MKKFPKELKFFFAVFFAMTLFFSASSPVLALENSFDYISGINYEPIAKLVNFLNDKKNELEKIGDNFGKTVVVKTRAPDAFNQNRAKKSFLLSAVLEPVKDAVIGKPKQYAEKVFCVAKDFIFPGACKDGVNQYYSGATTQEKNNKEEMDALRKQYDDAIVSANELNQKFNLLQKELGKIKAGGVVIKEPIIEQKTVERTIEKIVSGISQDDLSASIASIRTELNNLNTNLANQINNLSSNTSRQSTAAFQAISLTNKIDSLSGTRLSGITVSGVSGLTNSDIPDDITASNYLPLIGGTISGDLTVTGNATLGVITLQNATAGYFTATSTTQASTFPYASTTALTVSGSAYIGNLNGPLQANNGLVSATTSVGYQYGGTGLTSAPSFGQILRGTGTGYALVATSTLGINTSDLIEGSNLFWTNDRFDNRLSATTTLPNLTTLANLSITGSQVSNLNTLWDNRMSATTTLPNLTTLANLSSVGTITTGVWNGSLIGNAYINDDITLTNLTQITNRAISDTTGTLSVARGGTGQTVFGQGWLNSDGTTMSASTSPTVNYIVATSTTATSTFAGGLFVAGHCVTGDTRLRRRRKNKNGKGYEYDEVAIKDIQPGDEIASLDEETGKIVWSKVNALMDMGVKKIYKLTTAGGKTIRTTAEHPYFIKKNKLSPKKAIAFIDYANIKAWLRDKNLSIDLEMLIKTLVSAGISDVRFYYGSDPEKNSIYNFFKKLQSFGYTVITKPIQYFKVSLFYLLKQKTNIMLLESISNAFKVSLEKEAFRMDKENVSLFAPKANFDVEISVDAIKKAKNVDVFVLFSGDGDFAYLFKELKLLGKKVVVVSGRKSLSGALIAEADKFVTLERLSDSIPGLVWSNKNAKPARRQVLKNCAFNIADLLGLSNCSVDNLATNKSGLWEKVVYLKEGMEIAINDAENDNAIFDKIARIEILQEEQVYDIEVDGTHNFIGNDIVAHNTYISGTASSTNLIVSNNSALGTVSSGLWNGSSIATQYGGTGQNFSASSGLINLYSGTASAMATSSLGLLTTDVVEGINQYWTNTRFDSRLSATTTLPNLTTLLGLTNASTTALTVTGQTTLATTLTGLLKGASGVVSAITTSLGLAGEISDETGSGALVFGTSPTFTTQITTPSIISSSALDITPASGSNLNVNLAGTGDFAVNTNQFYVDTSLGRVGIGTTTPSSKLNLHDGDFYLSDTDVLHGMTDWAPTATYGRMSAFSGTNGGLNLIGLSDTDSEALYIQGVVGSSDPTDTTPAMVFAVQKKNGIVAQVLGSSETAYQFKNYSTNLMTILGSGNVGIGTTTPGTKLEVNGEIRASDGGVNGDANVSWKNGTRQWNWAMDGSNQSMRLYSPTDSVEAMRILASGNVGIGETSPGSKLSVSGGGSFGAAYDTTAAPTNGLIVEGNVGVGTASPGAKLDINETAGGIGLLARTIDGAGSLALDVLNAGTASDRMVARFRNGGGTIMQINADGNVGIGTTTPGAVKLAVIGDISLGDFAGNNTSYKIGRQRVDGAGWTNTPYIDFKVNGTNDGLITFSTIDSSIAGHTDAMVIDYTGNVGIGTTTPMSLLSLKGSSGAQMTIAQADTNYTQLTVDASGNFTLTPSGSIITIPDDNLKICSGDACQTTALNSGNGNLTVENNIEIGGNYNRTCATGYIWVPGSSKFGTLPGFCAMKYEAKNDGSNNAVSTAAGGPYVSIDQPTSRTKCEAVGLGYHLINEMEWMTIAENIAQTPINDMDDDAGLQLATGHSDNAPASAQATTASADPVVSGCNLSATMENGANAYSASSCEIQGDGSYGGDNNDKGFYGTSEAWATTGYSAGTANKSQLRTHILSNGNVIWDIAGNVWEWTDAYVNGTAEKPAPTADAWAEYTAITDYTTLNYLRPQNPAWTSSNGIGQYYAGTSAGQRGFFRGGGWGNGANGGVFTLDLTGAPSSTSPGIGFRCSR